jgi:hypothetical protein
MSGYDIIGDIHGCADELDLLLARLGYRCEGGVWTQPEGRQAVFVGDLIDRGEGQLRVLETVKALVDDGVARITLGNHELNALCWATPIDGAPEAFLREHSEKNCTQHWEFIHQLTEDQRAFYLEWFLTIPLWLDLGGIRVVHACWDEGARLEAERLLGGDCIGDVQRLIEASTKGSPLKAAVDTLLKGPELSLVDHGLPSFLDKDKHPREDARLRWWLTETRRVADLVELQPGAKTIDGALYPPIPEDLFVSEDHQFDLHEGSPIFYGHYWRVLDRDLEIACTANTACVDFSAYKTGTLVAYRWNEGETTIDPEQYVTSS